MMSWLRVGSTLIAFGLCLSLATSSRAQDAAKADKDAGQDVLAVINGEPLTQDHYDQFVQQYSPQVRAMAQEQKGRFMRELILQELLAAEGKRQQVDQDPEVQIRLRMQMHNTLARTMVQKSVEEQSDITDDKLKAHYEANKSDYRDEETVTASHILVKTEPEAKALLEALKGGKDFAELAKEKSTGPSGLQRRQLWVPLAVDEWFPPLNKRLLPLKPGEVSEPVQNAISAGMSLKCHRAYRG